MKFSSILFKNKLFEFTGENRYDLFPMINLKIFYNELNDEKYIIIDINDNIDISNYDINKYFLKIINNIKIIDNNLNIGKNNSKLAL